MPTIHAYVIHNYILPSLNNRGNSPEIAKYVRIAILNQKQVDILISKNQALQILYLKHCVYNNETT